MIDIEKVSDDIDRLMEHLVPRIENTLQQVTQCDNMHVSIVVWCKCMDGPIYCGSNDEDRMRVIRMLRSACDGLLAGEDVGAGHA